MHAFQARIADSLNLSAACKELKKGLELNVDAKATVKARALCRVQSIGNLSAPQALGTVGQAMVAGVLFWE